MAKCSPNDTYSSPYVVTPQSPVAYDPERIMKDAFEAASFAPFDLFAYGTRPISGSVSPASPADKQHLQYYTQGLEDMNGRYDDHSQLLNYDPVPAY